MNIDVVYKASNTYGLYCLADEFSGSALVEPFEELAEPFEEAAFPVADLDVSVTLTLQLSPLHAQLDLFVTTLPLAIFFPASPKDWLVQFLYLS